MTSIGDTILAVVNFLTYPTWHLVVLYVILLLGVFWSIYKARFPGYLKKWIIIPTNRQWPNQDTKHLEKKCSGCFFADISGGFCSSAGFNNPMHLSFQPIIMNTFLGDVQNIRLQGL